MGSIYVLKYNGTEHFVRGTDDESAKKEAEKMLVNVDKSWPNWRGAVLFKETVLQHWEGAKQPELPELKDIPLYEK